MVKKQEIMIKNEKKSLRMSSSLLLPLLMRRAHDSVDFEHTISVDFKHTVSVDFKHTISTDFTFKRASRFPLARMT